MFECVCPRTTPEAWQGHFPHCPQYRIPLKPEGQSMPNWVRVDNAEYITDDVLPLLRACLERAQSHHNVARVNIILQPRDTTGWLEFQMLYEYTDGGRLTVGALQRKPNEPFEFHS